GGGSLRFHALQSPRVIVGSSLAKGFGAPLAALGGSGRFIRRFLRHSETRVHTSPPSIAVLHAAEHALMINAQRGDELRRHLADLVSYFRDRIVSTGVLRSQGLFPVQMLGGQKVDVLRLHLALRSAGIRSAIIRDKASGETK